MKFVIIFCFFIFRVQAQDERYYFPIDKKTTSTVTSESFHRVFFTIISLYSKEMSRLDLPLALEPEWENPYITAYTVRLSDRIRLGFWGGMARIDGMNDQAVALITCHELGHVFGGAPFIAIDHEQYKNISAEGQADYFASSECLPRYYEFLNIEDQEHELYMALSGFLNALRLLKPHRGEVNLLGTSSEVTEQTLYNSYPSNQCRIDTYKAGLSNEPRPACWYLGD